VWSVWPLCLPRLLRGLCALPFSVYQRIDVPIYPAFLVAGVFPWLWFSASLNEATYCIIGSGGLIRKVYLPSEIFPLVPVGSSMVHFVASLPILFGVLAWDGRRPSWSLLLLPVLIGLQPLLTYGIALILSSLTVQFRDLLHIVPNFLTALFFATPIFYPGSMVPERYRILLDLNPLSYLITAYQEVLFFGRMPAPARVVALVIV